MNTLHTRQTGAVLIMALLLLFVMTLIGVSALTTSSMEERMAGNMRDRHLALQAAEAAMRDAENDISNQSTAGVLAVSNFTGNGYYALGTGPTPTDAFTGPWWGGTFSIIYSNGLPTDVKAPPLYTIEYRGEIEPDRSPEIIPPGPQPRIESFRITARGTGTTPNAEVILQSHWGQRFK